MIRTKKRSINQIINDAYSLACEFLSVDQEKEELKYYMFCEELSNLKLCESNTIGYTFKCVGAGFWALKQTDFRYALEQIVRNGGDADTNGAVAGALLGCKLGIKALPSTWLDGLVYKTWLDDKINKYLDLLADKRRRQARFT